MHYYRWNKTGEAGEADRRRRGKRPCRVEGCANDAITRDDLCPTHRRRKRLYEDENGSFATHKPCAICGKPSLYRRRFVDRCAEHAWERAVELYLAGAYPGITDPGTGYVYLSVSKERKAAHRAVMEQVLDRQLRPFENIHHKNGRRSDNRPENLELWTKPQPCGQRPEDLVAWVLDNYPELVTAEEQARESKEERDA